jgi:hypothetical protein
MPRKPIFKFEVQKDEKVIELKNRLENYVETLEALQDLVIETKQESNKELLSLKQAHEYLVNKGVQIPYNIFISRVNRKKIPYLDIDGKKYIQKSVLDNMVEFYSNYYDVEEAYKRLKEVKNISKRAFIGRLEKKLIPSIVVNRKRLISKDIVDGLVYVYSNYLEVADALKYLRERGVNLTATTLERRLDRKVVPYINIGKKRLISKNVLDQIVKIQTGFQSEKI